MSPNEMRDGASMSTIPYHSENDRSLEFVAIQNNERTYTNSRKSMTTGEATAPINHNPSNPTFTKNTWKIHNIQFVNYFDQDSVISDDVAKNIKEGIDDINSGRTYTSDQVKEMLGL